jgi:hypothetical protein
MPTESQPLRPSVAFSFRSVRRRMASRKAPWHVALMRRFARTTLQVVSVLRRGGSDRADGD